MLLCTFFILALAPDEIDFKYGPDHYGTIMCYCVYIASNCKDENNTQMASEVGDILKHSDQLSKDERTAASRLLASTLTLDCSYNTKTNVCRAISFCGPGAKEGLKDIKDYLSLLKASDAVNPRLTDSMRKHRHGLIKGYIDAIERNE